MASPRIQSFSNHGLPELIVSDNGTCFTSIEFKEFLKKNGIRHVTSAPYHAASNGLAERAVQTFKRMMKKCPEGTLTAKVARVLFSYRVTPHTTTGLSPAELLLGRKLRCTLDSIHPNLSRKVMKKQEQQTKDHNKKAKERWFKTGDSVLIQNFSFGPKWIPGLIESVTGPVSYKVMLGDGRVVRRHVDQIHTHHRRPEVRNNLPQTASMTLSQTDQGSEAWLEAEEVVLSEEKLEEPATTEAVGSSETEQRTVTTPTPLRRHSRREIKLPSYLKDFKLD
uniref:Integrase catalytic domain-containing protein n=1 Tax=Takifugu rubripes TaxID=31033 RepID=A0A674MJN5_TAKRU